MAACFDETKHSVLSKVDISPKGSFDAPIVDLLSLINSHIDYVTTSSCSGRIAIFVSNAAAKESSDDLADDSDDLSSSLSSALAKGIRWLMVSHGVVTADAVKRCLTEARGEESLTMLKCECLILHVQCRDLTSARSLQASAVSCGYRESGITISGRNRVMLAIRTTAFVLDLPLSHGGSLLLTEAGLKVVVDEANQKLMGNFCRIDRLLLALKKQWGYPSVTLKASLTCSEERSRDSSRGAVIERWGHACCSSADGRVLLLGGYGSALGAGVPSSHCRVDAISSLLIDSAGRAQVGSSSSPGGSCDVLHAVIAPLLLGDPLLGELIIVSGGRRSPLAPSPCLRVFEATSLREIAMGGSASGGLCCSQEGDIPSPRWGHTLTAISECSFLLYGGRDAQGVLNDCYSLKARLASPAEGGALEFTWARLPLRLLTGTGVEMLPPPALFFHAAVAIANPGSHGGSGAIVLIHGGLSSLADVAEGGGGFFLLSTGGGTMRQLTAVTPAGGGSCLMNRFGHTLTALPSQSLLLLGGASFTPVGCAEGDDTLPGFTDGCVVDYTVPRGSGELQLYARPLEAHLPCGGCRVHHQTVLCSGGGGGCIAEVAALGGGALCLGFGTHFCSSLSLLVAHKHHCGGSGGRGDIGIGAHFADLVEGGDSDEAEEGSGDVLLVSTKNVKAVKTLFEGLGYLDKGRRITAAAVSSDSSSNLSTVRLVAGAADDSSSSSSVLIEESMAGLMAVPITPSLARSLQASPESGFLAALRAASGADSLLMSRQVTPLSRSLTVSAYKRADEYLRRVIKHAPGSDMTDLLRAFPRKYEVVGDAVMISEDALGGAAWAALLQRAGPQRLWAELARALRARLLCRKGRIDKGPKRESTVSILHPLISDSERLSPLSAGPLSQAWVTVVENGIGYGFDIARVMFCSGNVTERMRMGRQDVSGEVIVDLYCGIGYYTLPFLLLGHALHVHACEWNPNSLLALQVNLERAKIHAGRYTIHGGDNSVSAPALADTAHRVCLGLLPSSEGGWPLAARVIRPSGGVLHVHENVHEDDIEAFVQRLLAALIREIALCGKRLGVRARHVERVKSYAPRVFHIVVDVVCEPTQRREGGHETMDGLLDRQLVS